MQGVVHHVRIQMAGAAGGDLYGGDALGADALGVVLGLEITLDDGDAHLTGKGVDGPLQQAGLAGTGR